LLILQAAIEGDKVGNALSRGCSLMCQERAPPNFHRPRQG